MLIYYIINYFFPEIFLFMFLLFSCIFGIFFEKNRYIYCNINNNFFNNFFILALLLTFILFFNTLRNEIFYDVFLLNIGLFEQVIKIIYILFSIIYLLLSRFFWTFEKRQYFEFDLIICFFTFISLLLIGINDLLSLYLILEIQNICLYFLAAFNIGKLTASEASLKYFILGVISSGFLIFGLIILYGFTGLINLSDIYNSLIKYQYSTNSNNNIYIYIACYFILFGLFFKLSIVPFHIWTPDIYEGSPMISTVFFISIVKFINYILFLRIIIELLLPLYDIWMPLIGFCSCLSIIIGTLGAFTQIKITRLFAYSSIMNMGLLCLPFICHISYNWIFVLLIYIIIYTLIMLLLFSILITFRYNNNLNLFRDIYELINIEKNSFIIAICFIFTLFSISGIPPLLGFLIKYRLIYEFIASNNYLLIAFILCFSIISCFYYTYLIRHIFFNKLYTYIYIIEPDISISYIIILFTFFNLLSFIIITRYYISILFLFNL